MSYNKLTPGCNPLTGSITSNEKYLNPFNQIYLLQDTYTYRFPGYDDYMNSGILNPKNPSNMNEYHGKNTNPKDDNQNSDTPPPQKTERMKHHSCFTCGH
jgi:hypothetical protein